MVKLLKYYKHWFGLIVDTTMKLGDPTCIWKSAINNYPQN